MQTLRYLYDLQLSPKQAYSTTPTFARPRYPFEVLFAIGGWSGGSATSIFEAYDVKTDRWIQIFKEDPQGPRAYHSMVSVGHDIYVIGGFNESTCLSSCKKFNTITKQWEEIAPMNSKRYRYYATPPEAIIEFIIWGGRAGIEPIFPTYADKV